MAFGRHVRSWNLPTMGFNDGTTSPPAAHLDHPSPVPGWKFQQGWRFYSFYPLVMTNIAIENVHRNSGFSKRWSFSIVMLNYQRVCQNRSSSLFVVANISVATFYITVEHVSETPARHWKTIYLGLNDAPKMQFSPVPQIKTRTNASEIVIQLLLKNEIVRPVPNSLRMGVSTCGACTLHTSWRRLIIL